MKDCISRSKIPLMSHQIKVVDYMSSHKSLLVVHGTGCGKTLSALTVSQCYLDNFPKNKVIVVSPASLVKNFEKEIKKYGSVITENYKFYSFEGFVKENKIVCKDSMIIIDEAHNIRSMKTRYSEIFKCVKNCDKLLLLTATPFVNSLLDFVPLINLLYRDEHVYEHTKIEYDIVFEKLYINYVNYRDDDVILRKIKKLLDRKISFVEKESSYFPDVIISKIDFTMSDETYRKYASLLKNEEFGTAPEVFFSGYRQAVNVIGTENYLNQKMEFINEILKENKKTIIYTNWLENGVNILLKKIKTYQPSVISGQINVGTRLQIIEDYNAGKTKVLILTKAGFRSSLEYGNT
jgi:superfamily II DNA or RNA helicase